MTVSEEQEIFLDNQLGTKPTSKVLEAYISAAKKWWKPIDGCYIADKALAKELSGAENSLYELVGAEKEDYFYFGASEREMAALVYDLIYFREMAKTGKNHIVTMTTENATLFHPAERMKEVGVELKLAPVNEFGQLTKEILEKTVSPRTAMVAVSWVHSLTGIVQPIWEIADFCQSNNIMLYVQAGDIFGKVFFRFQDLPVDVLSFETARLHGIRSGAGLFIKNQGRFAPIWRKEEGRLTSHRDAAAFIAAGISAEEVLDRMDFQAMETARLRNRFEDGLKERLPGITFFGEKANRLPNVSCFAVPGVSAEHFVYRLTQRNVCVSFGGGREQKLEYVLEKCGIDLLMAKCAVSISLSHLTTEREIETAIEIVAEVASELQEASIGVWAKLMGEV